MDLTCKNCYSNCKTCIGPNLNNCTSCFSLTYLNSLNVCVSDCGVGYYNLDLNNSCINCDTTCYSCNGST